MGNNMGKYNGRGDMYCQRRRRNSDSGNLFSKEYSEYWRVDRKRPHNNDSFIIEKNDYSFSSCGAYDSPLYSNRRASHNQFISSFTPISPTSSNSSSCSSTHSSTRK
ncbi:hypothetical protein WR25_14144 [Diploscapter pachys]|uniref:Uncharacterized protein n=1 Tax=Diploscapter pachys TaxID=2018661 RepID=A0A2A2KPE4_9BILA|nr:hypothetical protein WR25_14144 [Diploscapter pachys]